MKRTIVFFVILILLSSTASAIYQAPLKLEDLPSRNILIQTVASADGTIRQFTTGELIVRVPRQDWSSTGADETQEANDALPYARRQKFQADLEFGTQAHKAAITSESAMNRQSIFRRATPSVLDSYYSTTIDRSAEKKIMRSNYKTPTGQAILPGQEPKRPMFEGDYPPLMPGEIRPYNPEESGLTKQHTASIADQQMWQRQNPWMSTGAVVNPYALGGSGNTITAGQAYAQGEDDLTERENPYALGGTGKPITAGQAAEIEELLRQRQAQAQRILAQMNYK